MALRFAVITLFPEIINAYKSESIIKRAIQKDLVQISVHNLRNWSTDKHKTVDDKPFGGGAGMLLKIEPIAKAITDLKNQLKKEGFTSINTLLTAASGTFFTQRFAEETANYSQSESCAIILICGHYEGFDARIKEFIDDTISVGPYILTGGELPSLIIIDAITRLLPGVLGNTESSIDETKFEIQNHTISTKKEYPQYTRPAVFSYTNDQGKVKKLSVPKLLREGHHGKITEWKEKKRVTKKTKV